MPVHLPFLTTIPVLSCANWTACNECHDVDDLDPGDLTSGRQGWFRSALCWPWAEEKITLQLPWLHGNQCNFRGVREQTAEAACQAAPQNILEGEKYRVGTNNIPRHWAIRTALFLLTPPPAVTQSSMKSICCFVVLMIYLPLFWYSVMFFVGESLTGQWRLHTESKMPDVMNFNK